MRSTAVVSLGRLKMMLDQASTRGCAGVRAVHLTYQGSELPYTVEQALTRLPGLPAPFTVQRLHLHLSVPQVSIPFHLQSMGVNWLILAQAPPCKQQDIEQYWRYLQRLMQQYTLAKRI